MNFPKGVLSLFAKGLLLVVMVLFVDEAFWRALGFRPSYRDDAALWSELREEADGSPASVALVGSSRMHYGIDPEVLHKALPEYRFYQLAVSGSGPLQVLEDLALDQRFNGTAIVELPAHWLFEPYEPGGDLAAAFLAWRRTAQVGAKLESQLRIGFEGHLALFRPDAKLWLTLGELLREGRVHRPLVNNMDVRRGARLDFTGINRAEAEDTWLEAFSAQKERYGSRETQATMPLIASWAERINRRGGKVIFFRMNVTGRLRELEEQDWPHEKYWDVFARSQKSAVLSFTDFPELARFQCPDGSHIGADDVDRYSEAFASVLRRRKLL